MTHFLLSRFFFPVCFSAPLIFTAAMLWKHDPVWSLLYMLGLVQGVAWVVLSRRAPGAAPPSRWIIERPPPSTECPDVDFGRKP